MQYFTISPVKIEDVKCSLQHPYGKAWMKLTGEQCKLQAEHHDAECVEAAMMDVDAVGCVEVLHHWH